MSVSTEDQIMINLKSALESITHDNGFKTDVKEAFEGPAVLADHANRPSINFYCNNRSRSNFAFGRSMSMIHVFLTAYVDAQPRDMTNLRALSRDIERVLDMQYPITDGFGFDGDGMGFDGDDLGGFQAEPWPHREFTEISGFNYYFGGANESVGIVSAELTIEYNYDSGQP